MNTDIFLRRAAQLLRDHATYASDVNAWTISVPHLRMIFDDQLTDRPPELSSFPLILQEGVRQGCWNLDYDAERLTDIAVIR